MPKEDISDLSMLNLSKPDTKKKQAIIQKGLSIILYASEIDLPAMII